MQSSKLYVGNLNYSVTEEQLKELFEKYGEVESVKLIEERGFGFVEMVNKADAIKAREELNDTEFEGRNLRVDEARPQQSRNKGGSRGGGRRRY